MLTTPVVRCVKNKFQNAEVHFLTKTSFQSVVISNPHISKVYAFDNDLNEVLPQLKKEGYDFVVDLHKNIRSKRVVSALGVPSDNFPKLNYEKWLLTNFKVNKMPNVHIVDRYFEAVKEIKVSNDFKGLDFFIQPKNEINPPFKNYIALVVSAAHNTKAMTVDKISEVIQSIPHNYVLIGGPNDDVKAQEILKGIQHAKNVVSKCGDYNLEQSASAIKQSDFVITPDTGMMHVAAAFNKSIISVWGNTVPDFGMFPYMPENPQNMHIVEVSDLKCRPCSKIGHKKCPKSHFKCIKNIDVSKIEAIINRRSL